MEKIRPELNLEKWVSIWSPARSNRDPKERMIQREITLPDGSKGWAEVEVGFTNRGELTTEDQKTYYALVKHWEDNQRSLGKTYFSLRQLAKILQKRWGTNVIQSLTQSLVRLRVSPFVWRNSYYDASTRQTISVLDAFNILADLKIVQRSKDGVVNREVGYFRFNDFILKNLLANHTKPVLLDTILALQSDIAQLLYVYLDLIMADKQRYERRSKELFDDVGLEGVEYRKPSVRRRILIKVLAELRGRILTTGVLASARLERTKDRKDYKAIFRKAPLPLKYALPDADTNGDTQDTSPSAHAAHLVRYFHQRFHPETEIIVEPRELKTATELIANYGVERVRFIVDYVYTRTDFRPSFFGGVRPHAKRAIATYDEEQERQAAETAAAACQLCNNNGFILFRTPSGETFSTPCFHDLGYIHAREQDEGLTYLS